MLLLPAVFQFVFHLNRFPEWDREDEEERKMVPNW